eukprot:GHRR01027330.1.p2 GENE.GHRR01027330.1~~GHRR01027330.1.p2  ORF type:complete len:140 (+),score=59.80 GHRR01027330.1:451-870(+)
MRGTECCCCWSHEQQCTCLCNPATHKQLKSQSPVLLVTALVHVDAALALTAAQAWGEPCVMLHVAATNTAAQQLYLSCGFQPVAHSQGLTGLIKGPWTQQRMVAEPSAVVAECQHNITASAAICNNSSRHGSFKCSASG